MTAFLAFTTVGLVVGCIYALTATGLVVTYTTSGIFNFAHGAIGMMGAFTYWQFSVAWGLPVPLALALVLLVVAPLFGALVERVLIRPIRGGPVDLSIVITLGLLLFLIGLANVLWKPTETRVLPQFFADAAPVKLGSLFVSFSQILVVVVALSVAFGLKLLFSRTRIGIAMRGAVDDPDLLAMAGQSPARVQQLAWALGATLAALAGILLAPLVTLDILTLTLLVINGYAAALIGRLRSLPLTALGALILGLAITYVTGYGTGLLTDIQPIIPMILLFAALVVLPPARLRAGGSAGGAVPTVPSLRSSLVWAAILVGAAAVLSVILSPASLLVGGRTFTVAITLLSLVLLTGFGGQVSLCQLSFVGLGAFVMGNVGNGSLLGVALAVLVAALTGAAVALPTLRLRGLYLALATFAFAVAMDKVFFERRLGSGGSLTVPRLDLPFISTTSDRAFFLLCAVAFTLAALAVVAVRRGRYGRQLTALNDSPAACATLGLNINNTKLVVFAVAAGLAGLSGALFGGLRGSVGPNDFVALGSLLLLLTLRIGGINTVTGALLGGYFVASAPQLQDRFPQLPAAAYLLTGLAAISIGRDPNGIGGRISQLGERLRGRLSWSAPNPVVPQQERREREEASLAPVAR